MSAIVWIGFLPLMKFWFPRNMFIHYHALYFSFSLFPKASFLLFLKHLFCCVSVLFPSPSIIFWLWHPKSQSLPRTWSHVVVLHLFLLFPLFLIELGSVMRTPKRTLLRTSLIRWFIRNIRSFCLTFQTLLFPVRLALGVGHLFVRNPQGVPMCLYRSSILTYMPSIPLSLSLLR